jgi:ribosomal protein S18 acetylase RimI-like enzyme
MGGLRTDPERLASELSDGSNRTLLFLREVSTRAMVGCVFLERFEDEAGVGCYLGMLTVSPTLQDQGLGRLLLDHAEEYAKKTWGASRMTLGVIQLRESLMAWYERRGYKKTGMTKPFPYDQLTTDAPKRNDLYFVMFEKPI